MNIRIAFRNIFRHKLRSAITLSTIGFGCAALIFLGGYLEDTLYKMRESYIKYHTGHLQIYQEGYSANARKNPFDYMIEDAPALIKLIQESPKIQSASPLLVANGVLSTGQQSMPCLVHGVEFKPSGHSPVTTSIDQRRRGKFEKLDGLVMLQGLPLDMDQPYETILGKGVARSLFAAVEQPVTLMATTIGGSMNAFDLKVRGVFVTGSTSFDDRVIQLPIQTVQDLLRTDSVHSIIVALNETDQTWAVQNELTKLFQERKLPLEIKRWDQLNDFYQKTKILFSRMFWVVKMVIAIIIILSIYNTLSMTVSERTSEIGTLMAMGLNKQEVTKLFLMEGFILGILGGAAGIIGGGAYTYIVAKIGIPMPPPAGSTDPWISEPLVVPSVLFFSFMLSVFTSLFSSFFPALRAARMDIATALRHTN